MSKTSPVVVVDTNVLISGLIGRPGPPATILTAWAARHFTLATSEPLLDELEIVTLRPELAGRFHAADVVDLWRLVREGAALVTPARRPPLTDDPVDNALLMTALAARAQCIVTGDRKVLGLGRVEDIPLLSPREFITWLSDR